MSYRFWTETEIDFIKNLYLTASKEELRSKIPGRSWEDIKQKAYTLGVVGRSMQPNPHRGNAARYSINQRFFQEWSADLAYILGYIVGDYRVDAPSRLTSR